ARATAASTKSAPDRAATVDQAEYPGAMGLKDERRAQLFPRLSSEQIHRIASHGKRRRTRTGDILFERGEVNRPFFVVLAGTVEVRATGDQQVVVHGAGEFTGELDMLIGHPSLLRGEVASDGEVLELDQEQLRRLVQSDSELSDVIMRAFILRRMAI